MATKLKVNYEFVGDSTTPVTRTESIKHGDSMLNGVITSAVTALGNKADNSTVSVLAGRVSTNENSISSLNKKYFRTYAEAVTSVDILTDGDIFVTGGFSSEGDGGEGAYKVKSTSDDYLIPLGNKYAEYLFNDKIYFDAIGGGATSETTKVNDNLMAVAIKLLTRKHPIVNINGGNLSGGGSIIFGEKEYRFYNPVELTNIASISFIGSPNKTSYISFDDKTNYLLFFKSRTDGNLNDDILIKNITFLGLGNIFQGDILHNTIIRDCRFFLNNGIAINILRNAVNVKIYNCYFRGCGCGIHMGDLNTTITVDKCYFTYCAAGLELEGRDLTTSINITDSIFEYCANHGLYIVSAYKVNITNCWIEGNDNIIIDSDISLINTNTSIGFDEETADITVRIPTRLIDIYSPDAPNGLKLVTEGKDYIKGFIRYKDGNKLLDYTSRKKIMNGSSINISTISSIINGFIKVTADNGCYFASVSFNYDNNIAFTKISGTVDNPSAYNNKGVVEFLNLTNPVIELSY